MRRTDLLAGIGWVVLGVGPATAETTGFRCAFVEYCGMGRSCESYDLRAEYFIDTLEDRAYVLGALGRAPLVMIPAEHGLTFVEVTRSGNVMTTTIARDGAAVHSRNAIIGETLFPSQYYGTCERLET